MNIVFAGTPIFALPSLQALAESSYSINAIYTQPDRPAGRGQKLQSSPIKSFAMTREIPIFQPENFKTQESIEMFKSLSPDVFIVIAYGLILPRSILEIPRYGCINVHASLLPRWRGASPIQHAILSGDKETGITIMQMDAGMDTGDMLAKVRCPIKENDTAGTLHDTLSALAPHHLLKVLDSIANHRQQPEQQDNHFATYAPKIKKEDACIQWKQTAFEIDRQIRAFNPWPIAYTLFNDQLVKIHQAKIIDVASTKNPGTVLAIQKNGLLVATGNQCILIEQIQFPGGKIISILDYLNAKPHGFQQDQVLG